MGLRRERFLSALLSCALLCPAISFAAPSLTCTQPVLVGTPDDQTSFPWAGSVAGIPQIITERLGASPGASRTIMLLDAGADALFGTADDISRPLIQLSSTAVDIPKGLQDGKLLYNHRTQSSQQLLVLDAGQDRRFGTADDSTKRIARSFPMNLQDHFTAGINDSLVAWSTTTSTPNGATIRVGGCDLLLPPSASSSCFNARGRDVLITQASSTTLTGEPTVLRVAIGNHKVPVALWGSSAMNFAHILGTGITLDAGMVGRTPRGAVMSKYTFFQSVNPTTGTEVYEIGNPAGGGWTSSIEALPAGGAFLYNVGHSVNSRGLGTYVYEGAVAQRQFIREMLTGAEAQLADLSPLGNTEMVGVDGSIVVRHLYTGSIRVGNYVEICN